MRYFRTLLVLSACTASVACSAPDLLTTADPPTTEFASLANSGAIDPAISTVLLKTRFTLSPRVGLPSGHSLGAPPMTWSSSKAPPPAAAASSM